MNASDSHLAQSEEHIHQILDSLVQLVQEIPTDKSLSLERHIRNYYGARVKYIDSSVDQILQLINEARVDEAETTKAKLKSFMGASDNNRLLGYLDGRIKQLETETGKSE